MKPTTVSHITIARQRTPAEHLADLQREVLIQHIKDYIDAGHDVPESVREQARLMGVRIEVEPEVEVRE